MFHLFSKLLAIFIHPFTWALILLITGIIIKKDRLRKKLTIASLAILLLFSNNFLIGEFARYWDIRTLPSIQKTYSCAILLGGFASEGLNGMGYFNSSADRFIQGTQLLTTNKVSHLLISGGNGHVLRSDFLEADFVLKELRKFAIPDSLILIENQSKNTFENARFSKSLLVKKGLKGPYLLVTSAFHMRRALRTFESAGIEVIPYPCDYKIGMNKITLDDFLPKAEALNTWGLYIKEVIGSVVYSLKN